MENRKITIIQPKADQVEFLFPDDGWDEETVKCYKYLWMRDNHWTHEKIAGFFGWSLRTVYNYIQRWQKDGTMKKAQELYHLPQTNEIAAAKSRIITSWPDLLHRMVEIGLHGRSEHSALLAIDWLKRHVIDDEIGEKVDPGTAEQAWANKPPEFNPTAIPTPKFLTD